MYEDFTLSAAQRGYKQAGKKLKPRDSFDAAERDFYKHRNLRELRKARSAEAAAYGPQASDIAQHWRSAYRAEAKLSTRARKAMFKALEAEQPPTVPSIRRAYDAYVNAEVIERCIQHDDMMLRNAY